MLRPRVIPCLLLRNQGLVKTVKFKDPKYVGDPINAVKIFNDKEVDELVLLDISATPEKREPSLKLIGEIASEAFMPVAYGGGMRNVDQARAVLEMGMEKVVINTAAVEDPELIARIARAAGNQSVVVSIDVKKSLWGKYEVYVNGGRKSTGLSPVEHARRMEQLGAGELFLNSIDRDGTMQGYDIDLIHSVTETVRIPVVACGGAAGVVDFSRALKEGGASAVAAGSCFVFQGKHRAVLISYPSVMELEQLSERVE